VSVKRERRRDIRVPGPISGRIESKQAQIDLRDLSEGGCFINWKGDALKPGEQLELTLEPEGETSIIVSAETVYVHRGEGFGVLFTPLSEDTYVKLERLLAKLRRQTRSSAKT